MIAALVAAALASCAVVDAESPQGNSRVAGSAPWRERPLSLDGGRVGGTLTVPDGAPARLGVVINPVTDAEALLRSGMAVARYHINWPPPPSPPANGLAAVDRGKTVGVWLLASPSADVIGRAYFELIWAEGMAARSVVEHLSGLDFVAADRIGMAGISTNGFKVYSALLSGVPLRAAAIVGACADYHGFLRDSPVALDGGELALQADYEAWLREREPIRHAERLPPAALLMINGGRDHVIPTDCVERSSAVIGDAFARAGFGDRFRQIWLPEATHNDLVERTARDIEEWWRRWLS